MYTNLLSLLRANTKLAYASYVCSTEQRAPGSRRTQYGQRINAICYRCRTDNSIGFGRRFPCCGITTFHCSDSANYANNFGRLKCGSVNAIGCCHCADNSNEQRSCNGQCLLVNCCSRHASNTDDNGRKSTCRSVDVVGCCSMTRCKRQSYCLPETA